MIRSSLKIRRQRRRGYVLVLFAMLFWVLLGMAALVIDLGLARVKLRQMQSATDTAAIEALRDGHATSTSESDGSLADANRLFAHTLDSTGNPIDWSIEPSIYQTREVRLENPDRPNQLLGPTLSDPRPSVQLPLGEYFGTQTDGNESVQVIYRRGPEVTGRSSAPAIEWLFGRGTFLHHANTAELLQRGITFQAESLAETHPVMTFGPSADVVDSEGNILRTIQGVEYACDEQDWTTAITSGMDPISKIEILATEELLSVGSMPSIGSVVPSNEASGYIAIYATGLNGDSPGTTRVIGFGEVQGGFPRPGRLVAENVSSRWQPPSQVSRSLATSLIAAQRALEDTALSPALAPTPFTPAPSE